MKYPGPIAAIDDHLADLDPMLAAQTKARVHGVDVLGEFSDLLGQAYDAAPHNRAGILAEAFKRFKAIDVAAKAAMQLLFTAHGDLNIPLPWGDQTLRGTDASRDTVGAKPADETKPRRRKGVTVES